MPTYQYTAIASDGKNISGTEIAKDKQELGRILHGKGYILKTVHVEGKRKTFLSLMGDFGICSGVSLTDRLLFTRNLKV